MIDLGDVLQVAVDIRDANGVLTDPASAILTITLPDGTTTSPAVPLPSTTPGELRVDVPTTQAGRHVYRLVTTSPATAHTDTVNVIPPGWTAIVGLAETKRHMSIPAADTAVDEKLRGFVLSASAVVESIVGPVARQSVTETHHGGSAAIVLRRTPVISITEVRENGTVVPSSAYSLSDAGVLYRASNYQPAGCWLPGVNNIAITEVVGRTEVPPSVLDATKELIRINWRPQQGGNYSDYDQGFDDDYGTREAGEIRLGFFVPYTVMQRLAPEDTPDGFA